MTSAQQNLMTNIKRGFTAMEEARNDLGTRAELPPLGSDQVRLHPFTSLLPYYVIENRNSVHLSFVIVCGCFLK